MPEENHVRSIDSGPNSQSPGTDLNPMPPVTLKLLLTDEHTFVQLTVQSSALADYYIIDCCHQISSDVKRMPY